MGTFAISKLFTIDHDYWHDHKDLLSMLKTIVEERVNSSNKFRGDFLDRAMEDMETEKFLTSEFLSYLMFGVLFANFGSITAVILLTLKLLSEHPSVLEELKAENETIIKNRENADSPLSWEEYQSMTYTLSVVNEVLRLANVAPGLLRKVTKDIKFNGYTVPVGWNILIVTSAQQLNPEAFKDPIKFNPSRWKDLDLAVVSKNFMPFGGGVRQCAGSNYARAFVCTFLHVLVTKYSWTKVKGGKIVRRPILDFVDGVHIKLTPKTNN